MSTSRSRKRKVRQARLPVFDLDAYRDRIDGLQYAVVGGLVVFLVPVDRPRRWWQFGRRDERKCLELFGGSLSIEQLERWAKRLNRTTCTEIVVLYSRTDGRDVP